MSLETWELLSYVVTVVALPFAIVVFAQWCRCAGFRERLPELLRGEDPDFSTYILRLATEEAG